MRRPDCDDMRNQTQNASALGGNLEGSQELSACEDPGAMSKWLTTSGTGAPEIGAASAWMRNTRFATGHLRPGACVQELGVQELGVSKERLASIIARVGDSADAVRRELGR